MMLAIVERSIIAFAIISLSMIDLSMNAARADASLPSGKDANAWRDRCAASLRREADATAKRTPFLESGVSINSVELGPGGSVDARLVAAGGGYSVTVNVVPRVRVNPTPSGWSRSLQFKAMRALQIVLSRAGKSIDASITLGRGHPSIDAAFEQRWQRATDECFR